MASNGSNFGRLLICEGYDDCRFFDRLIAERNLQRFHIQHTGGRQNPGGNSKFGDAIRAFRIEKPKSFNVLNDIVIVADNDEDPAKSFANVQKQVEGFFGKGLAPATTKHRSSTKPRVSIFMVPKTDENGHLEYFCKRAAFNADRKTGKLVEDFCATLNYEKWNNLSRYGKVWLRTSLAARCSRDPFVSLGSVFKEEKLKSLIPVKDKSFNEIADFLASI